MIRKASYVRPDGRFWALAKDGIRYTLSMYPSNKSAIARAVYHLDWPGQDEIALQWVADMIDWSEASASGRTPPADGGPGFHAE